MTEESLTRDIKNIVNTHLRKMVSDVEWTLLMSIENYTEIICNAFSDKLFQCFQPLIKLKMEIQNEEKR